MVFFLFPSFFFSFFLSVILPAGGHYLRGAEVVTHTLHIMANDFARGAFGADHTSVLLKDILSIRKYWCEINHKSWQGKRLQQKCDIFVGPVVIITPGDNDVRHFADLLHIYLQQQRKNSEKFDRVMLARLIHVIIGGATQQCDIKGNTTLMLLDSYFTNIK